jgi:hypothetical protein
LFAESYSVTTFFFFQKKKQKALFCSAEDNGPSPKTSAMPTQGFEACPKKPHDLITTQLGNKPSINLLFPEKEAKSVVLFRRKFTGHPPRSRPRGFGACPKKIAKPLKNMLIELVAFFFFQKKKQKA